MSEYAELYQELNQCEKPEVLQCLYEEYSTRRRTRGAHIWTIAAIFIPLSISGVVALEGKELGRTFAIAIGSDILIWIWFALSEVFRRRCDTARAVCAAIEVAMLKRESPILERSLDTQRGLEGVLKQSGLSLGQLRLIIPIVFTLFWLLVVLGHCLTACVHHLCS